MSEPFESSKLARPTTLRLRVAQIEAIDAEAERRGQLRSELLVEAVDHWLLLNGHGLDAKRIAAVLDTRDSNLEAVEAMTESALELLQEARARLLAITLTEPPKIW